MVEKKLTDITSQAATGADLSGVSGEEENLEVSNASLQTNFQKIGRYYDRSQMALANARRQPKKGIDDLRIISEIGFRSIPGFETTPSTPTFQYSPLPTAEKRAKKDVVANLVMQSFGAEFDLAALNNNATRSVAVDPATGHSAERFNLGVKSLTGDSPSSIHHLVSRKGDLVNSVAWDQLAAFISNNTIKPSIQSRSVSVALEARYIRHPTTTAQQYGFNQRTLNNVLHLVPYTEFQYFVCAFILKKLATWLGSTGIVTWLGYANASIDAFKAQTTGCANYSDLALQADDFRGPFAEFLLPIDYKKGDTLPSYLSSDPRWAQRLDIFFARVPKGTLLSAWGRIFEKMQAIREYRYTDELFDTSLANPTVELFAPTVTGAAHVGVAERTGANQINQYRRADQMQNTPRSTFFSFGQGVADLAANVVRQVSSQLVSVSDSPVDTPIIDDGLCFNFESGQWEQDTTVNIPGDVQISRNKLATVQIVADEPVLEGEIVKGRPRLTVDVHRGSYSAVSVSGFLYDRLVSIRDEIRAAGSILTSAGGATNIKATSRGTKPPVNMHRAGLAIDMATSTGMRDPLTDPYVIVQDGRRKFRVYGRASATASGVQRLRLPGVKHLNGRTALEIVNVEDVFVDITAIFEKYGFKRISSRRAFPGNGRNIDAEWWHYQYEQGLKRGVTTFGEMLSFMYSKKEIANTPASAFTNYVFRTGNFRAA